MEKLHTASYIEHTGVLTRIMVARIGKDKKIFIKKTIFIQICSSIKRHYCETGGIIGTNDKGIIDSFQLDKIYNPKLYEYFPNISFLNEIINKWYESNVEFVGFVHSHLHNDILSQQDIVYGRKILKANTFLDNVLIGVLDLSNNNDHIKWYLIDEKSVFEVYLQSV